MRIRIVAEQILRAQFAIDAIEHRHRAGSRSSRINTAPPRAVGNGDQRMFAGRFAAAFALDRADDDRIEQRTRSDRPPAARPRISSRWWFRRRRSPAQWRAGGPGVGASARSSPAPPHRKSKCPLPGRIRRTAACNRGTSLGEIRKLASPTLANSNTPSVSPGRTTCRMKCAAASVFEAAGP